MLLRYYFAEQNHSVTGGFLSSGMEYVYELNPQAVMRVFGQELNPESYAICRADMLIKGQDISNIKLGNTLSNDQLYSDKFDYMLSNPPFGVDWKKIEGAIKDENTLKGFDGRFGPGLPRVSDGSLLFIMHLISKFRDISEGGPRIGIILNGSPSMASLKLMDRLWNIKVTETSVTMRTYHSIHHDRSTKSMKPISRKKSYLTSPKPG